MGSCCSKKSVCATPSPVALPHRLESSKSEAQLDKKKGEEESVVKKEICTIKHRKSHEVERQKDVEEKGGANEVEEAVDNGKNGSSGDGFNVNGDGSCGVIGGGGGAAVRTSSCTKEEVDAILIQCGRLSRSYSSGKAAPSPENGRRKYSGTKRSYDFDNENRKSDGNNGDDEAVARERENRRRERHRQSPGRRRTPSRERERDRAAAQSRSGSRERGGSGGGVGRRVSRSPNRRSKSPITKNSGANSNPNPAAASENPRPGKMVSVPATVSSLAMDKSANDGCGSSADPVAAADKRTQVKRNAGGDGGVGARSAASPRARSPARVRASNENQNANQQQPVSLSRSNSRKAENSPYRRNPLSEIDNNIISQVPVQKPNAESKKENRTNSSKAGSGNCKNQDQHLMAEETKGPFAVVDHVALNVIPSGTENQMKPHSVTRSRSSRQSRDLDANPETLTNPNASSYTALLLEDIQNFHQKSNPPAGFSIPPSVSKARSILEAVADLNSSTGSNLSSTLCEDGRRNHANEQMNKVNDGKHALGKAEPGIGDPIVESEIAANDDLMEPSFHKYVTVRRGATEDLDEQESSGSNSFAGSQQQWVSSSCWEPNSVESWNSSSRSVSKQNEVSPIQRHALHESGKGGRRVSAKKRDSDHQQNGIGRGRIGTRAAHPAAAAST